VTDVGGAIYIMAAAYLAGEVAGWTIRHLVQRMARRGRS
jgi:hypothetical protein